jgi:DNA-binding HxlR family transcriptional regulator
MFATLSLLCDPLYLHFAIEYSIYVLGYVVNRVEVKAMNKQTRRSDCPINFSLQILGDTWSLLIIRDLVYFGKKTYGEFIESDEGISTNILANRLSSLEQTGILAKSPNPLDKRKDIYSLTEKGLDLIPILLELAQWGAKYDAQTDAPKDWIALVQANKENIARLIRETLQQGGSVFVGTNSVINKLIGGGA